MKRNGKVLLPLVVIFLFSCKGGAEENTTSANKLEQKEEVIATIPHNGIPFEREGNFLLVNALIQDTVPARLILDTGAQTGLTLDSTFVRQNQLIPTEYYDGDRNTFEGRAKYIRGMNSLKNSPISVRVHQSASSLRYTSVINWQRVLKDFNVDGVLGMDYMDRYAMEINYQDKYIIFHKPEEFEVPPDLKSIPIAYDTLRKFMMMDVQYHIHDAYSFQRRTRVDIGYNPGSIGFGTGAVEKLNLLDHITDKVKGEGWGAPMTLEKVTGFSGKIKSIEMNGVVVDSPEVRLHTSKSGLTSFNHILLGNYIFSQFNRLVFNFRAGLLYVEVE